MTDLLDLTVPFLDILAPDFVADGPEVHTARTQCWRAETPVGPAVLHHEDVWTLLRDRRLGQGSAVHLDLQGVPDGPLARAELEEAITVLTASITDLRSSGPIAWRPATGICGPVTLPLTFRRRA